jgi:N-acetylated-alpha-linked acidic dipeptidase
VRSFVASLHSVPGLDEKLDLAAVNAAVDGWQQEAEMLQQKIDGALSGEPVPAPASFAALNNALLGVERSLLLADGIPGRPWFKHSLYAPRYTYAAMSLPGVREAAEAGDWDTARGQLAALVERLHAAAAATRKAVALVPNP